MLLSELQLQDPNTVGNVLSYIFRRSFSVINSQYHNRREAEVAVASSLPAVNNDTATLNSIYDRENGPENLKTFTKIFDDAALRQPKYGGHNRTRKVNANIGLNLQDMLEIFNSKKETLVDLKPVFLRADYIGESAHELLIDIGLPCPYPFLPSDKQDMLSYIKKDLPKLRKIMQALKDVDFYSSIPYGIPGYHWPDNETLEWDMLNWADNKITSFVSFKHLVQLYDASPNRFVYHLNQVQDYKKSFTADNRVEHQDKVNNFVETILEKIETSRNNTLNHKKNLFPKVNNNITRIIADKYLDYDDIRILLKAKLGAPRLRNVLLDKMITNHRKKIDSAFTVDSNLAAAPTQASTTAGNGNNSVVAGQQHRAAVTNARCLPPIGCTSF